MSRLFCVAGFFCLSLAGCEEKEPEKLSETPAEAANFETDSQKLPVVLPSGWTVKTVNGRAYFCGPTLGNHQPNFNLIIEPFPGTLNQYFEYSEKSLKKLASGYNHLERTSFKTDGGIDGIRFAHEMTIQGNRLRQTCYAFDVAKGEKHVFTCTVVASRGAEFAPIFDQIMRTFKP